MSTKDDQELSKRVIQNILDIFVILSYGYAGIDLALTDSEHLGATYRTCALSRWSTVLHGYRLWIFDLFLRPALNTICLYHSCLLYMLITV